MPSNEAMTSHWEIMLMLNASFSQSSRLLHAVSRYNHEILFLNVAFGSGLSTFRIRFSSHKRLLLDIKGSNNNFFLLLILNTLFIKHTLHIEDSEPTNCHSLSLHRRIIPTSQCVIPKQLRPSYPPYLLSKSSQVLLLTTSLIRPANSVLELIRPRMV